MVDDYLKEFVHESDEQITTLNNALLDLERDPTDEAAMEEIFRTAHTLKSNCGAMGFTRASSLAHAIEDLLEEVRAGRVDATSELMDTVFAGVDELQAMLSEVESHGEPQREADEIVTELRSFVPSDTELAPPSNGEIDSMLADIAPEQKGYNLYHGRLSIAGDETINGPAVIDALDDAFELYTTSPERAATREGPYGATVDALFGSVVDEGAVLDALEPVEAVEQAIITEVTDRYDWDQDQETGGDTPVEQPEISDPDDVEVDELLDSVDQYDDIDEMAEQIEDTSEFDDLGEAGSFADLDIDMDDELGIDEPAETETGEESSAEPAEAVTEDDQPEDANATFQELKDEVDPVSFDELQDELDDLEFDEYADEDEVGFDELLDEEELDDSDSFAPAASSDDDLFGSAADDDDVDELIEETIEAPAAEDDQGDDDAGLSVDQEPIDGDDDAFATGDDGIFDDIADEVQAESTEGEEDEALADHEEPAPDEAEEPAVDTDEAEEPAVDTDETEVAVDANEEKVTVDEEAGDSELPGDDDGGETVTAAEDSDDSDDEIEVGASPTPDDDADFGEISEPADATTAPDDETAEIDFGSDSLPEETTAAGQSAEETFGTDDQDAEESIQVGSGIEDDSFGSDVDSSETDLEATEQPELDAGDAFSDDELPDAGTTPAPEADDDLETVETETFSDAADTDDTSSFDAPDPDAGSFEAPSDPGFEDDDDSQDETEERDIELTDLGVPESLLTESQSGGGEVQSIRVDVDRMDSMLNLVEGLVTSRARLRRALDAGEPRAVLDDELGDLEDVTSELQDTVMDVRLVPLNTIVSKLPRTVRDIARDRDKQVDLVMNGTDVEIDRSILNEINDPLVHLVRNAVDHGIESPEDREAAEKDPTGTIELRAERRRDSVVIEVEDDGRGIDPDDLKAEAVSEGVLTEAEAAELSDEEAYELVFHSGLSTREEVTDVSGRGVGMDVVADTVESLDGTVHIDSELGEGTTIRLELPVTLAIAEVLFVQVGDEEYGIPIKYVEQIGPEVSVETQDGQEVLVSDGGETEEASTRELIRLDELLETPGESVPNGMLIHIQSDIRPIALRCDSVRSQQEVVIKPFEGVLEGVPGLSGATVLGDGDVVNILDVETL